MGPRRDPSATQRRRSAAKENQQGAAEEEQAGRTRQQRGGRAGSAARLARRVPAPAPPFPPSLPESSEFPNVLCLVHLSSKIFPPCPSARPSPLYPRQRCNKIFPPRPPRPPAQIFPASPAAMYSTTLMPKCSSTMVCSPATASPSRRSSSGKGTFTQNSTASPSPRSPARPASCCVAWGAEAGVGRGGAGWRAGGSRTGGQGLAAWAGAFCGARHVDLLHPGLGSAAPPPRATLRSSVAGPAGPAAPQAPRAAWPRAGPGGRGRPARSPHLDQPLGPLTLE